MGVDIWTDTVVIKHNGKFYPFWQLADNNLFDITPSGRYKRVKEWVAAADHDPTCNLWGIPEGVTTEHIKEIAERFFLGLLPEHVIKEGEVEKARKHFGYYSGIYYNSLGNSGNASLRRYVNRMVRAFQRAVTVEQLVCRGREGCNDSNLINAVQTDLEKLPTFKALRDDNETRREVHTFLEGISRNAVVLNGKETIEHLIGRIFFKKAASEGNSEKKYGVAFANKEWYEKDGDIAFNKYVYTRTRAGVVHVRYPHYRYTSEASAKKVVDEINSGKYGDEYTAKVIVKPSE